MFYQPDITAPGVNILAAYPDGIPLTEAPLDDRQSPFKVDSGTSMACPHVAGIVGLLKTLNPKWSPAAIKSAIMTTGSCSIKQSNQNTKSKVPSLLYPSFRKLNNFQSISSMQPKQQTTISIQ